MTSSWHKVLQVFAALVLFLLIFYLTLSMILPTQLVDIRQLAASRFFNKVEKARTPLSLNPMVGSYVRFNSSMSIIYNNK